MWFSHLGWGNPITGISWDYENIPLRRADWEGFLQGLVYYVQMNQVVFTRIYSREVTLSNTDYDLIDELGIFDFKWVQRDDPNAADDSLIQSCIDVLNNQTQINHVLLISGDGDFLELTDQLHEWQVAITLICQKQNYNPDLISDVHYAYTADFVAKNPQHWWLHR